MISSVRYIFVYGSLRPDDDSQQPWTKEAVAGMKAEKARLRGARMFHEYRYACIILEPANSSDSFVHGYVMSTENNDELFREKLSLFDSIEGYKGPNASNFYDRAVMDVELESSSIVKAYVYHRHGCNRENFIPSGDWLKRGGN
jgi:gamma-glutamylcyclotransferase (GGCT)/AIG2-like uncharacterized protein YtfP